MTKKGFTLAEILITLVVIGIIAAITVPMIHANYQKQETISKLKKAYSTLSQLVNRSQFDNGKMAEWFDNGENAQDLYDKYFKPYLRNAKFVKDGSEVYGSNTPYTSLLGQNAGYGVYSHRTRAAFFLDDGVFILLMAISNGLEGAETPFVEPIIFIDVNGGKKPNQFGKDVFKLVVSKEKGLQPAGYDSPYEVTKSSCSRNGMGECCLNKILHDSWEIKDDYPW